MKASASEIHQSDVVITTTGRLLKNRFADLKILVVPEDEKQAQPDPKISKTFRPYNWTLIPILERAITNARLFNLTTREMELMVSALRTQELNLFELPLD